MTPEEYLSRVFGPGALRITPGFDSGYFQGNFTLDQKVNPISGIERDANGISVKVTEELTSGHFLGPKTLPAYRMIELTGNVIPGLRIGSVDNAEFSRIVQPNDEISTQIGPGKNVDIRRNGKLVASMNINSSRVGGTTPAMMGLFLEIAAQTVLAQNAKNMTEITYPLITDVSSIEFDNMPANLRVRVSSTYIDYDKGVLRAGAEIIGSRNERVATVNAMRIQLVSERKLQLMAAWKRVN